ncbi:hypothetical protein Pcac1_g14325 [Phytophthora cactorum]|nr:hypothetical protein Pcac1_g14325 [Phytophthora cactorum]
MCEYHDAPTAGHPGREKTYVLLTRDFYWNHQYKWVHKYVRACEVCQTREACCVLAGSASITSDTVGVLAVHLYGLRLLVFCLTVSGGLVSWSL